MRFITLALLLSLSSMSFSENHEALNLPLKKLRDLASQAEIKHALQTFNGTLNLEQILQRDRQWSQSKIASARLLNTQLRYYFEGLIQQPGSPFVELILMANQGETLAAHPLPSDYWQGDEKKFQNVVKDKQAFIDELKWDESSQAISAQISVPVTNDKNEMIGVLTAGVEANLGDLGSIETK